MRFSRCLVWLSVLLAFCTERSSSQAASASDFIHKASPTYEGGTMPYRLYVAQGYNSPGNATRKYPLIVWLHGAGEKGTNNTSQMNNGVVNLANDTNQAYDPAFVMVPQLPGSPGSTGAWFGGDTRGDTIISERRFLLAIEDMCQQYRIDRDRIYVMGLSLGGAGSWEISMMYPDIFAASKA
jgi:predicted peptidase